MVIGGDPTATRYLSAGENFLSFLSVFLFSSVLYFLQEAPVVHKHLKRLSPIIIDKTGFSFYGIIIQDQRQSRLRHIR